MSGAAWGDADGGHAGERQIAAGAHRRGGCGRWPCSAWRRSSGALLASRRPRHPVGWLLLALGLSVAAAGVATGYANYGLLARPRSLPAVAYAALYHSIDVLIWGACLSLVQAVKGPRVPEARL